MTPNQSKEANKPLLEDDGTNQILGKIQSLAQYYGSIHFARSDLRATKLYDSTPLQQVELAYPTARQLIDSDPFLRELERAMTESFSADGGTPDSVSTSSEHVQSACGSLNTSTVSCTKRSLGEIDDCCNSSKRPRFDCWSDKGIT
jgi:hypothetical protein